MTPEDFAHEVVEAAESGDLKGAHCLGCFVEVKFKDSRRAALVERDLEWLERLDDCGYVGLSLESPNMHDCDCGLQEFTAEIRSRSTNE